MNIFKGQGHIMIMVFMKSSIEKGRFSQIFTQPWAHLNILALGILFLHLCDCNYLTIHRSNEGLTSVPYNVDPSVNLLYLDNNLITAIDAFPPYTNLTLLSLAYNQLTVFPNLVNCTQILIDLDLSNNLISAIPKDRVMYMFQELAFLNLIGNKLTTPSIPVVTFPKLIKLDLGWNLFKSCPNIASLAPMLHHLNILFNKISVCDNVFGNLQLKMVNFHGNKLSVIPKFPGAIDTMDLISFGSNPIMDFSMDSVNYFKRLRYLTLPKMAKNNFINPLKLPQNLTELSLASISCHDPILKIVNWLRRGPSKIVVNATDACFKTENASMEFVTDGLVVDFDQFAEIKGDSSLAKATPIFYNEIKLDKVPGFGEQMEVANEIACFRKCSRSPSCFLFGTKRSSGGLTCVITDGNLDQPKSGIAGYNLYLLFV